MLKHIHLLVSPSLKGRCEGGQQRQRLGFHDSFTRLVTPLAAIPRVTRFATARTGILQP